MIKRTITALVLIIVLLPAVFLRGFYFLIVGIILSMIASFEMMNMFSQKSEILKPYRYIVPIFSGLIVFFIYLATTTGLNNLKHLNEKEAFILYAYILVLLMAIIILISSLIFVRGSTLQDMMACLFTLTYCGLIMGFVISIEYLNPLHFFPNEDQKWGIRSFGYLISVVTMTDTFAYLIGSKFGKRKLCPEISPKKSVEGAIGGLVFGSIIGTIVAFLFKVVKIPNNNQFPFILLVFLFTIIISITVQIGDLIASKIKRSYGIKDFGNIFPGHGGVLDRFDSLLFSGIVFYSLIQLIQLIGI